MDRIINSLEIVEERERDLGFGLIDLLVYYEIPAIAEGKREEVKRKIDNFARINMPLPLQ